MSTYNQISQFIARQGVTLVAVSKTKPIEAIQQMYDQGQRVFGENRVQEMEEKYLALPKDIQWHLIGHLQKNKVKYIAPFVSMIHSVDSLELLEIINKEAAKTDRIISVLLQFYIAKEDTKFGLSEAEGLALLDQLVEKPLANIKICGVMGMASFSDDKSLVRSEFRNLKNIFNQLKNKYFAADDTFKEVSMGMSGDYELAIEEGSTMVRIGSALFGSS
ncbi:MAG TPA: YggS family pyridoxal phosphate-dependent enzyme [Saprospiraceae bacterium]|nr:YggS family pyridoxal phosphate-dependent enzyme [Saprospiraceae bacterium]